MSEREGGRSHPRHQLDDALLTPVRFSVMAALGSGVEIDFATLRDLIETEDSALSKAITHLVGVGYLSVRKGYVANKPRTWASATPTGTQAFAVHSAALQAIVSGAQAEPDSARRA